MGIIRLGEFLKKTYPQTFKAVFPQSFIGQTYAIDASSTIYSFLAKTISKSLHNKPFLAVESACPLIHMEI
jgi:hypothetical protein